MVLKGWRVLCRCPLALPMSPVSLPGDVHTCRPFRRPQHLSSRMCVMVRLMRRPAWWITHVLSLRIGGLIARTYISTCLSSSHTHVCNHTHRLHFGPRVAHCPEATHVCIVRAPVPPPRTHVPAPPHTLTSPTSHLSCSMYSASAVSSLKRQAGGIMQALCSLPVSQQYECISLTRC
jgi:hypothetical protein